jgi:hypothetical protein
MRVLITGAAGLIGRAITTRLLENGYEVRLIDLAADPGLPNYTVCDIMDFEAVRAQAHDCDAVVHMAALRSPFYAPGPEVYRINVLGTFNVFEAAAKEGIRRVVQASSINAIGCAWNIGDFTPSYLPVDEDHPSETNDPYSFSKEQIESIGAYYWRREGISSTALRFPGVYSAATRSNPQRLERRQAMREFLDTFASLPADEQQRQIAVVRVACLKFRGERNLEYPNEKWVLPPVEGIDERLAQAYIFDRYNLWASIDERDAALSVELSLTAQFDGSHPLFVNDTHNSLEYDSRALAGLFFPEPTDWKQDITGSESLFSIRRARELIGFEPQHSWYGA